MDKPDSTRGRSKVAARPFPFLAPAQTSEELGRLGRFRILKLLGKGGMGMVFKAEDSLLERIVAVKVMLPEFAKQTSAKERFLSEARAAARIEHEHVVAIHQVDEDRGIPFIAMTFLKGMSLDDWLKRKAPLTVPQILRIGREIARGLAAAHQHGLIHRDIKPANLWLDASTKGRIKILDFGLARPEKENTGLTDSGQILGTPAYMSPEQAAGEMLDGRSDIFSVGIVLYRLCTGVLPFTGKNVMAILAALASKKPQPANRINPEVPQALSDLIAKMLNKNREDRPASAQEVADVILAIERNRQRDQFDSAPSGRAEFEAPTLRAPSQAAPIEDASDSFLENIELEQTPQGTRIEAPRRSRSGRRARPMNWPVVAVIGGLGLATLLVMVFFILAIMKPRAGSVEPVDDTGIVELSLSGIPGRVLVERDGASIASIDAENPRAMVKAGRYTVRPESTRTQRVTPAEFEIVRGGRQVVSIRLRDDADPPP
jgi:serine/threonine protein kinase